MASQDPSSRKPKPYNSYLKYGGLAFQLLIAIALFGWLGSLVDRWLEFEFPVFLLLFGFLAFAGMMFQLYRSINKE